MDQIEQPTSPVRPLQTLVYVCLLLTAVAAGYLSYRIADLVIVNGWHRFGWPAVVLSLLIAVGITVYPVYILFNPRIKSQVDYNDTTISTTPHHEEPTGIERAQK